MTSMFLDTSYLLPLACYLGLDVDVLGNVSFSTTGK